MIIAWSFESHKSKLSKNPPLTYDHVPPPTNMSPPSSSIHEINLPAVGRIFVVNICVIKKASYPGVLSVYD